VCLGLTYLEYAFQAVKTAGLTAIAVKGKDTAVVAIEKKVTVRLVFGIMDKPFFRIDSSILNQLPMFSALLIELEPSLSESLVKIIISSFLTSTADARTIISRMRMEAAEYKFENGKKSLYLIKFI